MRLTLHTDYGIRLLIYLDMHRDRLVTTSEVADAYGISRNHLVKIAQHLTELDYVASVRGRNGGLRLSRDASEVTLGEVVRKVRMTAVALGLIGVLIILWPRLTVFSGEADPRLAIGALLVLGGSFCAALAQVLVRKMVAYEHPAAIVFWFSIFASVMGLLTAPFGWAMPSSATFGFLIGAGLVGGLGQIFGTNAYRFGDASIVAPFDYASILFALAIGYVFFSEIPTPQMIAGSAIVIAAGVLIIFRERQLRLARGKARQHVTKYG